MNSPSFNISYFLFIYLIDEQITKIYSQVIQACFILMEESSVDFSSYYEYASAYLDNVIFQEPLPLEWLWVWGVDWAGLSGHFLTAPTVFPPTAGSV